MYDIIEFTSFGLDFIAYLGNKELNKQTFCGD